MVLRETAIRVGVRSAARARSQIGYQFFQLDSAPPHFDPNKNFSFRRSDQQIKTFGVGVMLGTTALEEDVSRQPAALENQPGRGGELANIFAQQSRRFRGENPVGSQIAARFVPAQQIRFDFALLVNAKQIFGQAEAEEIHLPLRERRRDSEADSRRRPAECLAHLRELIL